MKSQIKLSMKISPDPTDADLTFARQLGLDYVYTWVDSDQRNYESMARLRDRIESAGLKLWSLGDMALGKSDKIHLGLPGRDDVIDEFAQFIEDIARLDVRYTIFTWEPTQVWSSPSSQSRGARARYVNLAEMKQRPFTHDREYTLDELWDNFQYFMDRILPVAEANDVYLALHPNDPPTDTLGGIPCLINSFERYQKAYEIANHSPHLGMEFCTGCWLEGGDQFGDMLGAITYFAERKKIFIVHFRNVTSPLPEFTETFLDNGYMDMYEPMKALVAAGYDGTLHLDHTPHFVDDELDRAGTAYAIGYIRALIARAEAELSAT